MKKRLLTVSFLLIAVFLLMASALAAGTINDLQAAADNIAVSVNGTDKIDVTCTGLTAGNEYLIMVLEGSQTPSSSNIVYMDQKTASSGSLTFTVNPMRLDDGDYYIAISSTDSDLTVVGTFTVGSATTLRITAQPKSVSTDLGKTAKTTVVAEGDGLSYQWFIRNKGKTEFSKSSIRKSAYSVVMSDANNGREVYCVVTDKYGDTVTSDTVTLSVKPRITVQPVDASAARAGSSLSASVTAEGDGLRYQWYIKNPGKTEFSASSTKSRTYNLKMTEANNGRQLYCVITDKYGGTVQTQTVTLSIKPQITAQPVSAAADKGSMASATVYAEGDGLTYQWYIKNPGKTEFAASSTKSKTYNLKMTDANSGRQAYCVVTDKYGGSVTSDTVTLSIAPKITKQPHDTAAASGKYAVVTVAAEGEGLTYQWYLKNPGKADFSPSSNKTTTYSVKMTDAVSGRQVYCVVTDRFGISVQTDTATLTLG